VTEKPVNRVKNLPMELRFFIKFGYKLRNKHDLTCSHHVIGQISRPVLKILFEKPDERGLVGDKRTLI